MHTAGVSYLQHHHHHHHHHLHQQQQPPQQQQQPSHPLPAGQPAQQTLTSQVPASHSNSVVQIYSALPHMAGGGGGSEIHTLGLQPFHSVQVSEACCLVRVVVPSLYFQVLGVCLFLRCPVRVWRVSHLQPLLCTAPGSRAPRQRPAASPPA